MYPLIIIQVRQRMGYYKGWDISILNCGSKPIYVDQSGPWDPYEIQ